MGKYSAISKKRPEGNSFLLYKRLVEYGKPYMAIFVIAVIANLLYSGIDALYVYSLKPLMDVGFYQRNSLFLKWVPFIVVGLFLLRAIANLIGNFSMTYVGRSVVMTFRRQIFKHFLHLPCQFYDKSSSGHLLSMVVYNSSQVANACTDALVTVVQSGFFALNLLIVMFVLSWQLSLIFLITAPFLAIIMKLSSKHLKRLNRGVQDAMGDISHISEEAVEGYKVVRTFGGEQYEIDKFDQATKKNLFRELKVVIIKSLSTSTVQLIGVIVLATMISLGTSNIIHTSLTPGGFIALISAMMALLKPMKDLTKVNATIQRGLAGAESIFELLDYPAEKDTGHIELERANGHVEYNNVTFSYNNNGPVLKNINFKVEPGKTIAFVGKSGSGKSTLVNLLPRFYDIKQGHIRLDNHDVFDISLKSLRDQFALVSQHVTLFNDTIAHNIAYGCLKKEVSEEDIIQAASAAHAMEFIENLPDGINTLIGENGVLLSGGQRQRLAIARAILKDAPILILDEATSALDTESERHIQAALEAVMKNRTTLVIAHRLSTIENADNIIVLDNGEIVEQGSHSDLLSKNGYYAKLHRLQFRDPQEIQNNKVSV